MSMLVMPDLAVLREWLDRLQITCFECDACQALHLPHMQSVSGVFDAKVDMTDDLIIFSALAELKPSMIMTVAGQLSQLNASSLTMKIFIDLQDDNMPKLVLCHTFIATAGITIDQFNRFLVEAEEQTAQIMLDVQSNGWLYFEDDNVAYSSATHQIH